MTLTHFVIDGNGVPVPTNTEFALDSVQIEIPEFLRDELNSGGGDGGETQPPETLTPKEFMDKYIASYEKACVMVENATTTRLSLNGKIIQSKQDIAGELSALFYYELVNDNINCYDKNYLGDWSASTTSRDEFTENEFFDFSNVSNSDFMREMFNKGENCGLYGWLRNLDFIALAFNLKNLDCIDGVYYGKTGTAVENYKFEVTSKQFIVTYLSDDPDYTFVLTFELGSEPIEIPQEAKDALENGEEQPPETLTTPSEFFEKFNATTAKKVSFTSENIFSESILYGNIVSMDSIKNNERYWEIDEFVEEYIRQYGFINGAWQACPYLYEWAGEQDTATALFEASISEILEMIQKEVVEASYDIENLVYANGVYTGKAGTILEGYTIAVSNNSIVYTKGYDEIRYTIGGKPIEIPQEALDAWENGGDDTVPDSISNFVLKWIDSYSKSMNVFSENGNLKVYGNLCHTLASDFEFYSEIKDDVVVQWLKRFEEDSWSSWNATAQKYDNKMDIVDAAWPGSISGFFDYDNCFEYKDGIYVGFGDRFEGTTIEITSTKMTITENGNVKCEMVIGGVEPFEIPEDVRNIYDGSVA